MNHWVLRVGDRSPRVAEVRGTLARLGLLEGFSGDAAGENAQRWTSDDAIFDEDLATSLRAFQQARGIIADGTITEGTLRALREATYTLGSRVLSLEPVELIGDDIAELQRQLASLGFYETRVDGHFGPDTHKATVTFQMEYGLQADGVVGPNTLRSLSYLRKKVAAPLASNVHEQEHLRSAGPHLQGKRVVVDPGGGPPGSGRVVQGPYGPISAGEILWDLGSRIHARMTAAGVETVYSRPRDHSMPARDRAQMANAFDADLLLSLQTDWYENDKAHGCATFYYGSEEGHSSMIGEKLSDFIQREIAARTNLVNCRYHGRTWDILRKSMMPSVQVVVGYLSSPIDVEILADPLKRDEIAEAIVVAVKRLYLLDQDSQATGTMTFRELMQQETARS